MTDRQTPWFILHLVLGDDGQTDNIKINNRKINKSSDNDNSNENFLFGSLLSSIQPCNFPVDLCALSLLSNFAGDVSTIFKSAKTVNSYFNDFTVFDRNISTTNSDSIKTKIKSEIIWKEISVNFSGLTMPLLSFENISTTENNENDPIFVFTVNELIIFCEKNKKLITEEKFEK